MNQVKVKTREKVKSIKVLDKAAIAGQRMKNAYIRGRETAVRNRDDRQNSPTGYAEEQVQEAARRMARNTFRAARLGSKAIGQKGRRVFLEHQNDNKEPPQEEHDTTIPKEPLYKETAPKEDSPPLSRSNPLQQKRAYRRYFYRVRKEQSPKDTAVQPLSPYAPTANLVTERGREFAKKQAAKRNKIAREIKTKELLTAIRQKDGSADFLPKTAPKMPVGVADSKVGTAGQFPAETAGGEAFSLPVKEAEKKKVIASLSSQAAKSAYQATPRPSIKVARYDKTAFQTGQTAAVVSEKAAQAAERAEKIAIQTSRFAAKSAAAAAKKAAKISTAAVKAILVTTKTLIAAIAAGGWVAVLAAVVIFLVGQLVCSSFGIFFSGEDNGTGQTMATAVQEIRQEFEERLAEIKSSNPHDILDQSGSCAPWPDVLTIYAIKTTTDPDNGQEVVTMDDSKKALLRDVFWDMNWIDYSVTEEIIEVSGSTTDEYGNTVDTTETEIEVTLHITIGHRTAVEMADAYHFDASQWEQLEFLLSPENRSLWDAVLRGTGANADGSGGGGGDMVSVALSQVGNVGGEPYWSWYGFDSRVEWCACFVSWCANESGCLGTAVPKFSSCADGIAWFKSQGRWESRDYLPQPGDVIFFDWEHGSGQDGIPDHVGIVEKVEGGTIYTIEGNSGNRCRENRYVVGGSLIYGYGAVYFT